MPWQRAPSGNWWFITQELLDDGVYPERYPDTIFVEKTAMPKPKRRRKVPTVGDVRRAQAKVALDHPAPPNVGMGQSSEGPTTLERTIPVYPTRHEVVRTVVYSDGTTEVHTEVRSAAVPSWARRLVQ